MTAGDRTEAVETARAAFDRAFAAGDAPALADLFAEDARLWLLHREPIEGRDAIRDHWTRQFGEYDTSAWRTRPHVVEVHDDRAYVLATYTETLVPRGGGRSRLVVGRLALFWRREPGTAWRVTVAMNSHVRPVEEVP